MSALSRVVFSSQSDHWATPDATKDALYAEFALTTDPNPLMSKDDALSTKWAGRVFCNPPYSKIADFVKKGLWHLASGDCAILVYLLPARTDTAWFHDFCLQADEIRFVRGRLKFGGSKNNAPFPSMVVIFKKWAIEKERLFA